MSQQTQTIGGVIQERRKDLGLTLRYLGQLVKKENGRCVSAQYLHDIERDRRVPSSYVILEIARALDLDADRLVALAGRLPEAVVKYLRENPDCASAVLELFSVLGERGAGVEVWKKVLAVARGA